MTEIFTAKTVDEAKAMAVRKFGKKASEIRFEIIDEGKRAFSVSEKPTQRSRLLMLSLQSPPL